MPDKDSGLLSGEEIKNEGLVVNPSDAMFRASTYDLSIGAIVPGGKRPLALEANGEYRLAPGGTVRVVARESLNLPDGITGHALPRNTLCTRGVLAINIGVVDPGFRGPISSTLINFGAADFIVKPGESFLRVSFHRCPKSPKSALAKKWDRDDYVEEARLQVAAYSAATFLNLEETVKQAGAAAFGKFKEALVLWVTIAAVALAVVTVLVPLGASYTDRYLSNREKWQAETEKTIQQKVEERDAARIQMLVDEVKQLRNEIAEKKATTRALATSKNGRQ
jgi:dUTPase